MNRRVLLTAQALVAAVVAAYFGALLSFAAIGSWMQAGGEEQACILGAGQAPGWCTAFGVGAVVLLHLIWSLIALPFALIVTTPPALILAHLAPWLEQHMKSGVLFALQYALGALAGPIVMGTFAVLTHDPRGLLELSAISAIAGLCGAFAFRFARYRKRAIR